MKLFCCYALTGEPEAEVAERLQIIANELQKYGHQPYCHLFDEQRKRQNGPRDIFTYAFDKLRQHDALVAVVSSARRSEGQLMEIGAAFAFGKPVFLLQHASAVGTSYMPKMAEKTYVWDTKDDLIKALAQLGREVA